MIIQYIAVILILFGIVCVVAASYCFITMMLCGLDEDEHVIRNLFAPLILFGLGLTAEGKRWKNRALLFLSIFALCFLSLMLLDVLVDLKSMKSIN